MRFRSKSDAPDLHTQFESLLDQVWQSESDWRLWDRIDAAEMLDSLREKRRKANENRTDSDLSKAA